MPLPMVHLLVAESLKSENINKTAEYYLGAISPDAVHMREDYKREHKTASHFAIKNVGTAEKLADFLKILKNSYENDRKDFLKGYLVHILTDKLWLDTLYKDIYLNNYQLDKAPLQDERMAYYNDTDQIDYMLYEKMPGRKEIFAKLENAKIFGIEGIIRAENVYLWRKRNLTRFNKECDHKNPVKYIKYDEVLSFASFAAAEIEKLIPKMLTE